MIDGQIDLRSGGGNLTANETGNIVDLGQGGTGIHGMDLVIRIPTTSGGGDTEAIVVQHSNSATFAGYPVAGTDHSEVLPVYTTAGQYRHRIHSTLRYVRLTHTVTDVGGGGVNFGAVEATLTLGSRLAGGARP